MFFKKYDIVTYVNNDDHWICTNKHEEDDLIETGKYEIDNLGRLTVTWKTNKSNISGKWIFEKTKINSL